MFLFAANSPTSQLVGAIVARPEGSPFFSCEACSMVSIHQNPIEAWS
jgi:hypothetical protein